MLTVLLRKRMIQLLKLLVSLLNFNHLIGTKIAHHLPQDGSACAANQTGYTVEALKLSLFD